MLIDVFVKIIKNLPFTIFINKFKLNQTQKIIEVK